MELTKTLDTTSKLIQCIGELAKLIGVFALVSVCVWAVAEPRWAREKLRAAGFNPGDVNIDIGVVKIKLTEASSDVLNIAGALNKAETALLLAVADANVTSTTTQKRVEEANKEITAGREYLSAQAASIEAAGKQAGLVSDPPKDGWLFFGLAGKDGKIKMVGYSLDKNLQATDTVAQITKVKLTRDAVVSSGALACTPVKKLDEMPTPTADQMAKPVAMIIGGADSVALQVVDTIQCSNPSGINDVWVKVSVPANQVRFTTLTELKIPRL